MSVSQGLRFAVLERDGFACQYCGRKAPEAHLEIDHIKPVSLGGTDDMDNVVAACKDCNGGKAGRLLREAEANKEIRSRLKALAARRALLLQCVEVEQGIQDAKESEMWIIVRHWQEYRGEKPKDQGAWEASYAFCATVRGLLARLDFEEVLRCVDITLARHRATENETHAIRYLYAVARNREGFGDDAKEGRT